SDNKRCRSEAGCYARGDSFPTLHGKGLWRRGAGHIFFVVWVRTRLRYSVSLWNGSCFDKIRKYRIRPGKADVYSRIRNEKVFSGWLMFSARHGAALLCLELFLSLSIYRIRHHSYSFFYSFI